MTSPRDEEEEVWIDVPHAITIKVLQPLNPDLLWPLVELSVDTPRVLEAFRHFRHQDSWDALYRAFEIVESEVGGDIHRSGWVTKLEQDLFTWTANSLRHAKGNIQPPPQPMTLDVAIEFVRKVLRAWLESTLRARALGRRPRRAAHLDPSSGARSWGDSGEEPPPHPAVYDPGRGWRHGLGECDRALSVTA